MVKGDPLVSKKEDSEVARPCSRLLGDAASLLSGSTCTAVFAYFLVDGLDADSWTLGARFVSHLEVLWTTMTALPYSVNRGRDHGMCTLSRPLRKALGHGERRLNSSQTLCRRQSCVTGAVCTGML